ncbi:polycomb group MEDEA [Fusarium pseudocircinatum]|uniref:Polycomb group MEDEA n=1 Tax=Fusarium pseudocircinatum TaxID=56676 RepID=A0A8H5L734_9HYPO|nr:polycomb group MEDEA [Fusarium pseudocircinatum]
MASHHFVAIVAGKPDTIDLTGDSDSDYEPHSLGPVNRNNTTTARFTPNFSISSERPSSTNAPVSPPRLNRSTSSIAASQDKQPSASAEPPRPASSVLKLSQKVTTITANSDDSQSMAKLSSVTASNLASRQVTPTPEKDDSKPAQQSKPASPKYQTPKKQEWDVAAVVEKLTQFRQDIKDGHSRMTSYIIESTKPNERRVMTGKNLFAGLVNKPVASKKGETMRIKSKEHTKLKNNKREDHYSIVRIQTDEERVPRYRFHHVEIKKNILTPNTMLTFVPHLRDLETSEEYKYNVWLQELEDIDRKSGFKPMSREEKVRIAVRSEFASTVLLYLGTWLDKLSIPGCNKSALIRFMASREPDDAITPRQKSDILNSHRPAESTTPPEANKAAHMFTEAFRRVFHQGQPPTKQIELRDVLLLDESVDSIMETKPTAKDGSSTQHENEHDAVEYWLGTYSILGCLICFSHSCEHGEYDAQNCKRTLSILPRLSDTLKRRRRLPYSAGDAVNGNGPLSPLCKRNCYRSSPRPVAASTQRPWDEEDHFILRSTVATADRSKVTKDPFCLVAQLLDRDCSDVFNEFQKLNVSMSPVEPANRSQIRTVSWYDRFKKTLIGDWESHTKTHEHQKRELFEACNHEGPCTSESCICVQHGVLCEKFCGCTVENCAYKFTGCACHSQGKTCLSKGKERPCICVQLNRECDPDVCGRCGVVERADPENADDEILHSTGCQNCSLQRGQAKSLALGESQLEGVGYGLFTIEDISQDDFIIEYVGELITHDEGVRREARRGDVFDEESNISYVFTLLDNEGIWVDAATYGNLSRYINHASESDKRGCNITPRILYVNGEYRIKFTAMRDIKAGEELFFNYGENFPNLTKKLLDHKVGGKSDQGKKRSRRPNGEGVARKNPKTDKKKPGKGKKRAQAVLDEDDVLAGTLGFAPKPLRKRKKGPFEEDSEEEEYHPTGTDASIMETPSDGDSDFGNSAARLRKRARQDGKGAASSHNGKPRGDLKTRGKRGGARPGSGRPRKYPRKLTSAPMMEHPSASESQDREDPEERQIVAADTIVPTALQRPQPMEINDSMEYITFSEERTEESRLLQSQLEEDNDDDDDDEDQDVVVRSRVDRGVRNRRPTAKLRDDGDWLGGSQ